LVVWTPAGAQRARGAKALFSKMDCLASISLSIYGLAFLQRSCYRQRGRWLQKHWTIYGWNKAMLVRRTSLLVFDAQTPWAFF
jgi:hypothetical protein